MPRSFLVVLVVSMIFILPWISLALLNVFCMFYRDVKGPP